MPRSVRLEYAGAFYHVMARGNRRQAIFKDDQDRRFFLKGLEEICGRTGWQVHAWTLMDNHYHLFIETPELNLVAGMKWLQNAYTRRFNTRHKEWGRLFGDRYKAVSVEGRKGEYYATLADYIHLNPVRAGLVKLKQGEDLLDYAWSSLAAGYALPARRRAAWQAVEAGLEAMGFADTAAGRRRYVERLEKRGREEPVGQCGALAVEEGVDGRRSQLRRGWYWGSQAFAEKLHGFLREEAPRARNRTYRSSAQHRSHGEAEAERLLATGLKEAGLRAAELTKLRGNDNRKVELAKRLWANTTVSQEWIAERLQMKSAANVSQILRRAAREGKAPPSRSVDCPLWLRASRSVD